MSTTEEATLAKQNARDTVSGLTRSVMYQVYLRSFTDKGTLTAAMERLPSVADLGVDVLYLCPVFLQDDDMREEFWSPRQQASGLNEPRNPYRIKDYFAIDPEYGTEADLRAFIGRAHQLGMRVILDMVYLHCGPTAPILEEHPDFVKRDADGKVILATWNFPAINFESAGLREYFWRNMTYWIEAFGVDGLRCDVSGCIPLDFWEEGRRRLERIKPDVIMVSESEEKDHQLMAFDVNYNFTFSVHKLPAVISGKAPASEIRAVCETQRAEWPRGARFLRCTDNHDIAHDTRDARHDIRWGLRGSDAALVLMFTLDGVPMLYNGQEVADTAPHSLYGKFPIEWNKADTPEGQKRRALCRKLCELRHTVAPLASSDVQWINNDQPDTVVTFLRSTPDERVLVVINLSNRPVHVKVDVPAPYSRATSLLCEGVGVPETVPGGVRFACEAFAYSVLAQR